MAANKNETSAAKEEYRAGPRLISLEVEDIQLYDRNPRQGRNPEYDRIKQSILRYGLEQPLVVSRRPGEENYVVTAGGNTRLQILKELFAASRDPSLSLVPCVEVGWKDETNVLVGHLRENSLRGSLTFADKAAAIVAFAELYAEEQAGSRPTIDELRDALRARGLPISKTLLVYMRYAAEYLMAAMPVALSDGLGWHRVARIRKLHRLASALWVRCGIGPADEFDGIFAELCRRNDGSDWQFGPLQRAVEIEITEAADLTLQTVRLSLQAAQFLGVVADTPNAEGSTDPERSTAPNQTIRSQILTQPPVATKADESLDSMTIRIECEDGTADMPGSTTRPRDHGQDPFHDLRQRAFGVACALARRFSLGDLVIPLPDNGNGFLVSDLPPNTLLDRVDPETRAAIGTMWWQLLAFSETACAPPELISERLPSDSTLRAVLEQQDLDLLFERVDIIDAALITDRFWSSLGKEDWQDWLYLAHTHRAIRAKVIEVEQPLWSAV